ncbi:zinc finger CCCH domain-containing protein 15 [Exaiptasia diaphana]|uniref:C3H1-type domain-containing protein n=1 Tax=Exaiptasia diaphana TaxID=2652724 RepID=A0A913WV05_EXADI|nr:zinc finger CCCH domain-containing protein 15 [Exaiptasia diaphana]KXJ27780.1 hypothetical protein AC249_AIPGENE9105 [Exaiptasia diaphana]
MSLLGLLEYEGSSSDSSDSEDTKGDWILNHLSHSTQMSENAKTFHLPSPELEPTVDNNSSRTFQESSVFYNPFKAEEKKKLDLLEKHVHLSSLTPPPKRNKGICYKFQKGKCRFGDKCRFAHNVSLRSTEKKQVNYDDNHLQTSCEDEDQNIKTKYKKRKVGLSDSVIPPKRAMKAFYEQKGT